MKRKRNIFSTPGESGLIAPSAPGVVLPGQQGGLVDIGQAITPSGPAQSLVTPIAPSLLLNLIAASRLLGARTSDRLSSRVAVPTPTPAPSDPARPQLEIVINNASGYNATATVMQFDDLTDVYIGQMFESASGEHLIVTNLGATATFARGGVDNTTADTIADNEILTEIHPTVTETDDMTSSANWTVENPGGGTFAFGAGGAEATLAFNVAMALYYNVPTDADWTTIRLECNYEKSDTFGLRFGITTNNPPEGPLLEYEAARDKSGYVINKEGTYTYVNDLSDGTAVGNQNGTVDLDAVTTLKCIITKMGDGKVRFMAFKEGTKADTGGSGITDNPNAYTGAMLIGMGVHGYTTGDHPIIKDFQMEVF